MSSLSEKTKIKSEIKSSINLLQGNPAKLSIPEIPNPTGLVAPTHSKEEGEIKTNQSPNAPVISENAN
jgi:hypothetical protein